MAAYQLPIEERNESINFAQGEFMFVHIWEHRVTDAVEVHHHGWHEFVWNRRLEGSSEDRTRYEMILDGQNILYGPGDLLYVPPYRDHAFVDQLGLWSAVIGIDSAGFERLAARSPVGSHFASMLSSWSKQASCVRPSRCFLDAFLEAGDPQDLSHQLRIIFELDRMIQEGEKAQPRSPSSPQGKTSSTSQDDLVRRALGYMEANFQQPLDVLTLAQHLATGRSTLSRRFSACMGLSIPAYLQHIRIRHAMTLLAQSRLSVLDVALECGFADSSHFARAFREGTGLPPGEWRRRSGRKAG